MKKTILITSVLFSIALFIVGRIQYSQLIDCVEQLKHAEYNNKALIFKQDSLNNTNRTLQLTIEQLEYYNDSLTKTIKSNLRKSKIDKDKISQLQYMLSTSSKVDTITFRDTVFVKDTYVDTTLTDSKWYKVGLILKSPNTLIVNPKFTNEFTTVFSHKKETIKPPKKCFIGRWFQRKHIITETTIISNNPYSTVDTTRFIEIIK